MALVQAYTPLDMFSEEVWYGVLTKHDASTIEITAGDLVARYTGSFSYDDWGNVYGQFRGYQVLLDGDLQGSVTDFSVDAFEFMQAVNLGDIDRAYDLLFSRSDELRGSSGGDWLSGHGGSDRIYGNGGNDRLYGDSGNDSLWGGNGADSLQGGSGDDRLFGGDRGDTLKGGDGADTLEGGSGKDKLEGGSGRDTLRGGSDNDGLRGDVGDDRLYGGSGTDRLDGGAGSDRLYAGQDSSHDVFDFNSIKDSRTSARDILFDFDRGEDEIDLRGIDARSGGDNDTFNYSGTKAQAHSVWWDERDGDVVVSADVTGDRSADFQLKLEDVTRLTSDEFLL